MKLNPDLIFKIFDTVIVRLSGIQQIGFSTLLKSFLNPIVSIVIGILTVWISRKSHHSPTARERLDKVYHPLFIAIEPFLYKDGLAYNDVVPFLTVYHTIEKEYSLLITPSFRQEIDTLEKAGDPCFSTDKNGYNHWFQICKRISKEYDKLCRQSYLPIRSISYRFYYKQYSSKISMIFAFIWLQLPAIIIFTLILGVIPPIILFISYCLFFIFLLYVLINEL